MKHSEYIDHLRNYIDQFGEDSLFSKSLNDNQKEVYILVGLNFDTVIPILESIYSPKKRGKDPRDPVCMLRSMILMTLQKEKSITKWVKKTRNYGGFLGILAGFEPDSMPGVGTYYDFMKRIIDGPYTPACPGQVRRSKHNTGGEKRNLPNEREAKKENRDPNNTKSEKLAKELLAQADSSRAEDFNKIIEDLLYLLGIKPCVDAGLINDLDNLVVTGDGSIMKTAASKYGKPSCECRDQGIYKCEHDRIYSSSSAEFCYDHHHDCFVFGDRYYHLILTQAGHDFPIHGHMPGGNESDYTLSLTSVDRTLKMNNENKAGMEIKIFGGDGHHDSNAHYDYFKKKDILPVIPLADKSKAVVSRLPGDKDVLLNKDAVPLCPAGKPMRHHVYNKKRSTHVFTCPIKCQTHKCGKAVYVTHIDKCPQKQDCKPESSIGPFVYIRSESDPRLFPQITRGSKQFKKVQNLRSGSERVNAYVDSYNIEKAHRNVDYSLIRLILAYIAIHADIRYREFMKTASSEEKSVINFIKTLSSKNNSNTSTNIRDGPDIISQQASSSLGK